MARRIVVAVTMAMAGASLAAGHASAGGWATVGLDSVPDGVRAGEPWVVHLTILQARPNPTRGCATRAHDRASLIAVITDSDRGGDLAAMPEDFGRRMSSAELNALVDFLLAAGGEG
jgi:hypothetical protein